jgi:hypothetical protein
MTANGLNGDRFFALKIVRDGATASTNAFPNNEEPEENVLGLFA